MKPLHENYRIFVLLGICPPDKPITHQMRWLNVTILISFPAIMLFMLTGSFVFIVKHILTDLAMAICACFQIGAVGMALYLFITAYVKRNDLKEIFDNYQAFYNTSKLTSSSSSFFLSKPSVFD